IVDGIVGGLTGGFKGAATSVIGYLNDIVYGVNDKTKSAATAAQIHTAEMKDKSIENAQKMNEGVQTKLINMRNNVEGQLKQTTDTTKQEALKTKLTQLTNKEETVKEVHNKNVQMRTDTESEMDKLKASSKQKHGDIIQDIKNIWGGLGNWFHGIWVDVQ